MEFNFPGELIEAAKAVSAAIGSGRYSVGAGVGRDVGGVIRTIEAVVVNATRPEMSSRNAEVIAADAGGVTHAGTTDVGSAEATHVGSAKTPHATSANATHVTSTKAAHVAAAKAATMSAATTTAAGLRTRGSKAAGKQRGCQNHHQSSFHDLSPLEWAGVPPQDLRHALARLSKANTDVVIDSKMGVLVRSPH